VAEKAARRNQEVSLFKRGGVYWAIWMAGGIRQQKSTVPVTASKPKH